MISNQQEAVAMLMVLAAKFKVEPPVLRWAPRKRRNSHYKPGLKRISLAAGRHPAQYESSLVHEFTHHLMTCHGSKESHGEMFWQFLWLVAQVWYGVVKKEPEGAQSYPWHQEYRTGRELAAKGFHQAMLVMWNEREWEKQYLEVK